MCIKGGKFEKRVKELTIDQLRALNEKNLGLPKELQPEAKKQMNGLG